MTAPKAITEMFAWVCTEPNGDEGIPAMETRLGAMPLVGADRERIESLRPFAIEVSQTLGLPVKSWKVRRGPSTLPASLRASPSAAVNVL